MFTNTPQPRSDGGNVQIIVLVLLLIAGFVAFRFGGAFFDHSGFEKEVEDMARTQLLNPYYELQPALLKRLRSVDDQFAKADLEIQLHPSGRSIEVDAVYHRQVDLVAASIKLPMTLDITVVKSEMKTNFDTVVDGVESNTKAHQKRLENKLQEIQ